jgi:hypothetical protein
MMSGGHVYVHFRKLRLVTEVTCFVGENAR